MFQNEKKSLNMLFAIILNGFSQKINEQLNRVFKFGLNTRLYHLLAFAENGQFTNKKGIEKLS